jgi:hypothetical protein
MAVFIDLEDESEPPEDQVGSAKPVCAVRDHHPHPAVRNRELRGMEGKVLARKDEEEEQEEDDARPNPNRNVITQALGCYP